MVRDRQRRQGCWPRAVALAFVLLILPIGTASDLPGAVREPGSPPQPSPAAQGAILGRLVDETGAPLSGAIVQARRAPSGAAREPSGVVAEARTGEDGTFRLSGVPIGSYVIATPDPAAPHGGLEAPARRFTYYPGVSAPADATRVSAAAPDPAPIEFRLHGLRLAQVRGTIKSIDDRPLRSATLVISRSGAPAADRAARHATVRPDETFVFTGVPPGRYVIRARGETVRGREPLYATFTVLVAGRDLGGIALTLSPGGILEGTLRIEPRHGAARPRGPLRVRAPLASGADFGDALGGGVDADGSFRLAGLAPGAHLLFVEGLPFPWRVARARVGGRDVEDTGFQMDPGRTLRGAQLVVSDAASAIAGTVATTGGIAAEDVLVVAFPTDPARRRLPLRFVRFARPRADGSFTLGDLAPGDHLVVAAAGIDEEAAKDAAALERLAPFATRVTLSEAGVHRAALTAIRAAAVQP